MGVHSDINYRLSECYYFENNTATHNDKYKTDSGAKKFTPSLGDLEPQLNWASYHMRKKELGLCDWTPDWYPQLDFETGIDYEEEDTNEEIAKKDVEVDNVSKKVVTGSKEDKTISFKDLPQGEYKIKETLVERYDKAEQKWVILSLGTDYNKEVIGDTIYNTIINEQKEIEKDGILYILNPSNKTATILSLKKDVGPEDVLTIPENITMDNEEYRVTKIASKAFEGKLFSGINLPNNMEQIAENAFEGCANLTEVLIPQNVSSLHINAFSTHNVNINIVPENPNYYIVDGILYSKDGTILYGATRRIDLSDFVVPEGVTEIKENAFTYYGDLTEITIGKNVESIAPNAFDSIKEALTIIGHKQSYAEQYASENNINFKVIYTGFFVWEEDNYNFINDNPPFLGYYIGDIFYRLSNTYREKYNNFVAEAKENNTSGWGGSCAGMAITTILMKYKFLMPQYWQEGSNYEYELAFSDKLSHMINFYHVFQSYMRNHMLIKTDVSVAGEYENFFYGVKSAYENVSERLLLCDFFWSEDDKVCRT